MALFTYMLAMLLDFCLCKFYVHVFVSLLLRAKFMYL